MDSLTSLRDSARDASPVMVGYVTLGLAAGMLLAAQGLAWWWAPVWSVVIYSGTMQMLLVPLAGAGQPLAAIAASALFVSGRHVFYGLGFPLDRIHGRILARLYAVHAITDEVYALLASKDRTRMSGRYLLGVEVMSHSAWITGTTVGALAGTWLADLVGERIALAGFVLTALFVVLAIENWRAHPDRAVLALGVVAGGVGLVVGGSAALLAALGVLAAGLVVLYLVRRRRALEVAGPVPDSAPTWAQAADSALSALSASSAGVPASEGGAVGEQADRPGAVGTDAGAAGERREEESC